MAIRDRGETAQVFISNLLSGTITRFDLVITPNAVQIVGSPQIASGFNHRTDPAALVLGPSGLAYDARRDVLYVASSADNAIYAIADAGSSGNEEGTPSLVYQDLAHLHGPLDLVIAPNGDLIVANSDGSNVDPNQPSELVEFTQEGKFVAQFSVDKNNGGAFGLGLTPVGSSLVRVAAVDDNQNTIGTWTVN